jgi:hypothetical protein
MEINMDAYLLWTFTFRQIANRDPKKLTEDEFYMRFGHGNHRIFNFLEHTIRNIVS